MGSGAAAFYLAVNGGNPAVAGALGFISMMFGGTFCLLILKRAGVASEALVELLKGRSRDRGGSGSKE